MARRFTASGYSGSDANVLNVAASTPVTIPSAPPPSSSAPTESRWESYVPALKEFFFGKGARTDYAIASAKVADLERKVASAVWPLKGLYETQLAKARAELAALSVQAGEEQEAAQLQQALRITVVVLGLAFAAAGIATAVSQVQRARLLEAERRRL